MFECILFLFFQFTFVASWHLPASAYRTRLFLSLCSGCYAGDHLSAKKSLNTSDRYYLQLWSLHDCCRDIPKARLS